MTEIQQFQRYTARVAIRRGDDWEVRPECERLDGQEVFVTAGWLMDEADPYPGEWAMWLEDSAITWIASGDLTDMRNAGSVSL